MTYQIEYLPSALRDLTDIAHYVGVKLQNPSAADNLTQKIVSAVEKLAETPYQYPVYYPIKTLQREYRKMMVQNYWVFYWVDEENHVVTIAKVIYGNSQVENKKGGLMSAAKKKSILIGAALSVIVTAVTVSTVVHFTNHSKQSLVSFSDTASFATVRENQVAHTVDMVTRSTVYDGSFRSQLTEAEKVAYDALVQHFVVERKSIEEKLYLAPAAIGVGQPDSNIGKTLEIACIAFNYDYPEIYWQRYSGYDVQYDGSEMKSVTIRFEEYYGSYSEADAVFRGMDEAVAAIRETRKSESRYDTVKTIHDYICQTVEYDSDSFRDGELVDFIPESASIVPMFGGGPRRYRLTGEGYVKSFKALCNRLDVPCVIVNDIDNPHSWNMVQMEDGIWYGVDVTWDDIRNARPVYTYFLAGQNTKSTMGSHGFAPGLLLTNDGQWFLHYPAPFAEETYGPGASV